MYTSTLYIHYIHQYKLHYIQYLCLDPRRPWEFALAPLQLRARKYFIYVAHSDLSFVLIYSQLSEWNFFFTSTPRRFMRLMMEMLSVGTFLQFFIATNLVNGHSFHSRYCDPLPQFAVILKYMLCTPFFWRFYTSWSPYWTCTHFASCRIP